MKEFKDKLSSYSILIVEDDDFIREKLVNTLEFYFGNVFDCNNTYNGYELYLKEKPNLILTDIEMKDENGIELVKKIRKVDLDIPIVVLSAYSKEEYLLSLINLNISHYILKPATNKKLFEAISLTLFNKKNDLLELNAELFLDSENNLLIYKDEKIDLRKKEKNFLEFLYKNKEQIVNYDMIQEYIWVDKFMTQNALKTFIKELRQKLPVDIIENIIQEGYRLKR